MSRVERPTSERRMLPVIAVGGMIGAGARHAVDLAWPTPVAGIAWSTLLVNVSGCLLIGALMVVLVDSGGSHPVARGFVGVGILGGYTTFSTYAVQTIGLWEHAPLAAAGYLFGTLVAALAAVALGVVAARSGLSLRRRSRVLEEES